jgi:hypothetical protein
MATFLYIGGFEFDDTELPAAVNIFGQKFIQEVPKTLTVADFPSRAAFDHAVMKLSGHQHFQKLEDDVHEVIREKKKPGRKPKAVVEAEDAKIIVDAAE